LGEIEFSFLNDNLVVRQSRQPISMLQIDAAHPQNGAGQHKLGERL
jgi:hypothetical protein